jgi:hypothetical protein
MDKKESREKINNKYVCMFLSCLAETCIGNPPE